MLAGGGYDLGLLLDGDADRAGAADERGTFIHQLQVTGLLMYYLAEHRGLRDPVVISVNNTSMAARLGEHYGIAGLRDAGRLQVHRAEDDRDRRDDGRRGVRRLRVRDAPARARRHLRRPAAARPVPAREGRRALAGVARRSSTSTRSPGPSFYQRVDVHIDRDLYAETKRRLLVDLREQAPAELGRPAVTRTDRARHERRLQVLRRRRLVAARPASGTEPLVRVYTEATSADARDAMLAAGEQLVRGVTATAAASAAVSRSPGATS